MEIDPGAFMHLTGPATKTLDGRDLHNGGTVAWFAGDVASEDAEIVNESGALFDIHADAIWSDDGATTLLLNSGTVQKSAGAGTTTFRPALESTGLVDVAVGTLALEGGGEVGGQMQAAGGAGVRVGTGTLVAVDGFVFAGDGVLMVGLGPAPGGQQQPFFLVLGNASVRRFALSSGTVDGPGTLTVTDALDWTGGRMTGTGSTVIAVGAALDLSGQAKTLTNRALVNNGVATWDAGDINANGAARITNAMGATFLIHCDAVLEALVTTQFSNNGTIRKEHTVGETILEIPFVHQAGVVEVLSGTLSFMRNSKYHARIDVSAAANVSFRGLVRSHEFYLGSALDGAGTYRVAGSATLDVAQEQFTLTAHNLTVDEDGELSGVGMIVIDTQFIWSGGKVINLNQLLTAGQTSIEGNNPKFLDGSRFKNQGTLTWTGLGDIRTDSGSLIENLGVFDIRTDAMIRFNRFGVVGGSFYNLVDQQGTRGILRKTLGNGSTRIEGRVYNYGDIELGGRAIEIDADYVENRGTIKLEGGDLSIIGPMLQHSGSVQLGGGNLSVQGALEQAGGSVELEGGFLTTTGTFTMNGGTVYLSGGSLAASTVVVATNGQLSGPGNVHGNLVNAGIVNVGGGWLVVNGNYSQLASGALLVELRGTGPGEYDVLDVTGTVQLQGQLTISLAYSPTIGDSFRILRSTGQIGGTFGAFSAPDPGAGAEWGLEYTNEVLLRVVQQ